MPHIIDPSKPPTLENISLQDDEINLLKKLINNLPESKRKKDGLFDWNETSIKYKPSDYTLDENTIIYCLSGFVYLKSAIRVGNQITEHRPTIISVEKQNWLR